MNDMLQDYEIMRDGVHGHGAALHDVLDAMSDNRRAVIAMGRLTVNHTEWPDGPNAARVELGAFKVMFTRPVKLSKREFRIDQWETGTKSLAYDPKEPGPNPERPLLGWAHRNATTTSFAGGRISKFACRGVIVCTRAGCAHLERPFVLTGEAQPALCRGMKDALPCGAPMIHVGCKPFYTPLSSPQQSFLSPMLLPFSVHPLSERDDELLYRQAPKLPLFTR
jgi:hypothetical protein